MMYALNLIQMGNTIGSKMLSLLQALLPQNSCDPYDPIFSQEYMDFSFSIVYYSSSSTLIYT